ncbi:MAG: SPASM domain-containing protein [Flavobacteriales bacterium]|nr:SPASM domain-containing protein [Flavobacteriales bacterium]
MHLNDKLQILKKTTFRRVANAAKVYSSFYVSKWRGVPNQKGKPLAIAIEPTTACNLGCPECPSGLKQFTRPTGNLKEAFYKKVIDQVWKETFYLTFYFQGEPYINPKFLDMVKYANDKKMYTTTSTNAHFLTEENAKRTIESGLDRLIISVDGTTQETYENYRKGGKLEKVLEGTKSIVKWKKAMKSKTPHIIFQFLVVKPNEHQIDEVYQLAKEYGVNEVKLKTAQVYDFEDGNELIPDNDKYSRYRMLSNGKYEIKNSLENNCWKLWHSCVITWDGKVIPCCFDKDANHRLGELEKNDFESIWFSENYNQFRKQLFKGRENIDICKNCSEGTKVWA